jgi:hypothetical protein
MPSCSLQDGELEFDIMKNGEGSVMDLLKKADTGGSVNSYALNMCETDVCTPLIVVGCFPCNKLEVLIFSSLLYVSVKTFSTVLEFLVKKDCGFHLCL